MAANERLGARILLRDAYEAGSRMGRCSKNNPTLQRHKETCHLIIRTQTGANRKRLQCWRKRRSKDVGSVVQYSARGLWHSGAHMQDDYWRHPEQIVKPAPSVNREGQSRGVKPHITFDHHASNTKGTPSRRAEISPYLGEHNGPFRE